jgi:hypothetical protein
LDAFSEVKEKVSDSFAGRPATNTGDLLERPNLTSREHVDQLHAQRRLLGQLCKETIARHGPPRAGRQRFYAVLHLGRCTDTDDVTRQQEIDNLTPSVLQTLIAECPSFAHNADRSDFITLQKQAPSGLKSPDLLGALVTDAEFRVVAVKF